MSDLNKLKELAKGLGGESWGYRRTTPYSRGYITGKGGRTIVQTCDGEVPANVCHFIETADPETILALIERLEAAENRIAELECSHSQLEVLVVQRQERAEAAEAELARRDKEAGEPAYYVNRIETCDKWGRDVELGVYESQLDASKSKDDHGGVIIGLFTAAQPAALPPEVTEGQALLESKRLTPSEAYLKGANSMRDRTKALGVKPLRVKLPDALLPANHRSGEAFMAADSEGNYLNREFTIKALKAQGIEVEE